MMYIIRHAPTKSVFSIRPKVDAMNDVCVFPNYQHARKVAKNIASFRYAMNAFPSPSYINNLFKDPVELIYENEFTPFNHTVMFEKYDIRIDPIDPSNLFELCRSSNLNVMFCVMNDDTPPDLIHLPIKKSSEGFHRFLEECYNLS